MKLNVKYKFKLKFITGLVLKSILKLILRIVMTRRNNFITCEGKSLTKPRSKTSPYSK
jgi:hypothetical protein